MTIFPEYCGPIQSNKRICGHIKKSHFKNNSMDALWIWHIYCVTWLCNHLRNWNYSPDDKHFENLGLMAITFAVPVCIKNSVWAWLETYYFSGCGGRDKSGKSIRIQVPSEGKQYHREATLLTQTRSSLPSSGETVSARGWEYNNIQRLKRMTRTGSDNCSPLLLQMENVLFSFHWVTKSVESDTSKVCRDKAERAESVELAMNGRGGQLPCSWRLALTAGKNIFFLLAHIPDREESS